MPTGWRVRSIVATMATTAADLVVNERAWYGCLVQWRSAHAQPATSLPLVAYAYRLFARIWWYRTCWCRNEVIRWLRIRFFMVCAAAGTHQLFRYCRTTEPGRYRSTAAILV